MNFKIISIVILLTASFVFPKTIIKKRNYTGATIKKEFAKDRSSEQIINIDFEGDVANWYDYSNNWELTSSTSNSLSHSYNSPDINNSGYFSAHSLYSQSIELPSLTDEEIIQYSFALNCNMPDYLQSDGESLADYYMVAVRDINSVSQWHISTSNPTDGPHWWCANQEGGGYFDNWIQYLDTPSFAVQNGTTLSADMSWNIEGPEGAEEELPNTCGSAGWDQANVQISIDDGLTWIVINGSTPYDFECGYATVYNGFDALPGWGGNKEWHNISFDLSSYEGENAIIRFAFYSDPAYSIIDDTSLTGLQIDNITVSGGVLNDDASNPESLNASGENWVEQFYDYCDETQPGYPDWDIYGPGDAYNGNTLLNLTSFSNKTIQFRFQTLYDGDHSGNNSEGNSGQGLGLYIDDLILYKKSTFNPIPPANLTGFQTNDNYIQLSWNDLNLSVTGQFVYDNDNFPIQNVIYLEEGDGWVGTEFYTAGVSVVDSIYIHVFGSFAGQLTGFSSFGSEYNVNPDYNIIVPGVILEDSDGNPANGWVSIPVNNWTFYGSFIIAQSLSGNYGVGYDPTAVPSNHSKIFLNNSWEDWSDIVAQDNDLSDGEWGIRAYMTYDSPDPEVTYNIYRNNQVIASEVDSIPYIDENLEGFGTYTYNVSTLYENDIESDKSEDLIITIENCDGIIDQCGICEGNNENQDCEGVCFGNALEDECSICNGPGIPEGNCDCDNFIGCSGQCDSSIIDDCGDCNGNMLVNSLGIYTNGACDCEDTISPQTYCIDNDGDGLGNFAVELESCIDPESVFNISFSTDCTDVNDSCPGGDFDTCGVCNGNNNSQDCAGNCFGDAVLSGCDNTCESTLEFDECGECGGNGIEDGKCDCDGNVDLGCGCGEEAPIIYYKDLDGDGLGSGDGQLSCVSLGEEWVANDDDDDEIAPSYPCNACETNDCIYDCSGNCIDQITLYGLINNGNCDNGESGEFDLKLCDAFQNDGLDCIVNLSINNDLEIPKTYLLSQNFPNPFNPTTTIPFSIPKLSNVELKIYNIVGQELVSKSLQNLLPGNYEYSWNAGNYQSGVYIYTLETSSGIYLKQKMALIK